MIRPTSIEVRNVRSVTHAVIQPLQDGITSLNGPVGSGKSSILAAFLWCLYGEVGGVDGMTSQATLRRDQAPADQPVEAIVEFTHEGNEFRAVRRLRANKSGAEKASAELWIDGEKQPQITPTKLTAKIEAITGLTGRAFTGAFFIAQNALPSLAKGTPAQVQSMLEEQIGLEPLVKSIKDAHDDARTKQARADALPGSLEDVQAAQAEVDAIQTQGEKVWPTVETKREQYVRAEDNARAAYTAWDDLSRRARQAQDAQVKVAQLDGQIETTETQLEQARADAQNNPVRDVEGLPRMVRAVRQDVDRVTSLAERSEFAAQTAKASQDTARAARAAVPQQPQDPEQAEQYAGALGEQVAQVRARWEQYAEQARKLQALNGSHCPTCTQALPDPDVIARPIREAIDRVAQEGRDLAARQQQAVMDAKAARAAHTTFQQAQHAAHVAQGRADSDAQRAQQAKDEYQQALTTLRERLDAPDTIDTDALIAGATERVVTWQNHLHEAERVQQIHATVTRLQQGLDSLRQTREQAAAAMHDAPTPEQVDTARDEYTSNQNTLDALTDAYRQVEREADQLTEQVRSAERERDRQQAMLDKKADAATAADTARYARNTLTEFRKQLLTEVTEAVSESASDLMEQVGAGEHVGVHLDGTFVPHVILPTGKKRPMSVLSGGEMARAALCLWLGIAEQIDNTGALGMIFADEVTAAHDTETALHVADMMRSLGRPMILVSHSEQMQQVANRIVHVSKPSEDTGTVLSLPEDISVPTISPLEDQPRDLAATG